MDDYAEYNTLREAVIYDEGLVEGVAVRHPLRSRHIHNPRITSSGTAVAAHAPEFILATPHSELPYYTTIPSSMIGKVHSTGLDWTLLKIHHFKFARPNLIDRSFVANDGAEI